MTAETVKINMDMKREINICFRKGWLAIALSAWSVSGMAQNYGVNRVFEPLTIAGQGSFTAGGIVMKDSLGRTFHGDHAYVFYQIPVNAHRYPLVFVHGIGQSGKTWETTPDGREGFQTMFLRRGFGTYLVDQPRRGRAGRSTLPTQTTPVMDEQMRFDRFRLGIYPDYFEGVQFRQGRAVLDAYFRQMTSDTGPLDFDVVSSGLAAVADSVGGCIFVTHSQGGPMGWATALKTSNIRAFVSYEPGGRFPFPAGELPEDERLKEGNTEVTTITTEEFMAYTRMPIVIYYGDNIPDHQVENNEQNTWRLRLFLARQWAECVNRHGGDATVVHLPEAGLYGNTHFPFSDLNNEQVADLLSRWLHEKNLDK